MPIYERSNGVFRVVVWANGQQHERVVRGGRRIALAQERRLRAEYGSSEKPTYDAEAEDASDVVWIGGASRYVYFVQAGKDGPIKIGFSEQTGLRLRNMQSGNHKRLRVLCVTPGGRMLERALHRAFDRHRIDGEWFRATKEILALAAELAHTVQSETMAANHGEAS